MRKISFMVVFAALMAIGAAGYFQVAAYNKRSSAQTEMKAQQAEVQKCRQNLALFYQAWKNYKADHKGAEPPNIDVLVPKYIPDPGLFICPTAQRWISNHKAIDHGNITINKHDYLETYGFQWLSPNAAHAIKHQGDKAPLVYCSAHQEGVYLAVFHKKPGLGAFDADKRGEYIADLKNARPLVVRRNGTVEEATADGD